MEVCLFVGCPGAREKSMRFADKPASRALFDALQAGPALSGNNGTQ